ncbi:MAG: N-acetylmuramoyl-L-alanine amidase [Verrucomicrobiae bacterium]|nr:N-acetylmuramoyl-L-alanine amidase [Verrucomicrobiae bacterium]
MHHTLFRAFPAVAGSSLLVLLSGCVTTDSSDNGPLAPVRGVILDAGHGGNPPEGSREECWGAIAAGGFKEKTGTLAVARKTASHLRQAGFGTVLTRNSDTFLTLEERTAIASHPEYRDWIFVSIHFNRSSSKQQAKKLSAAHRRPHGFEIYVMPRRGGRSTAGSRAPSGYATVNDARPSNLTLARCIGARLEEIPGLANRGVKEAWFVVLRQSPIPAVLIEAGFLSNPEEGVRITTEAHQEKLARAIAEGIRDYAARASAYASAAPSSRGRS